MASYYRVFTLKCFFLFDELAVCLNLNGSCFFKIVYEFFLEEK